MATNSPLVPSAANTSAGAWGLRYPGLVVASTGKNYANEFTGMWRLTPNADLDALTKVLAPGGWVNPPGATFSEQMTKLGLIRTARWFVARTQDFDGYTLFFISQFDGTLQKYFDDFVLNGAENLQAVWGHCVGCPSGPGVTAREVVQYIARGQIKTLACYDVAPSQSVNQIYKAADWYEKTLRFQRAIAKADGYGEVEETVNTFLQALSEPYEPLLSGAMIDTDVAQQWQYEDVAERVEGSLGTKAAA